MCTSMRFFVNPYDGREYLAKCGSCAACLQEKAMRRRERIEKEFVSVDKRNVECFFITVHYDNNHVPYILASDVKKFCKNEINKLPVYRGDVKLVEYSRTDFVDRGKYFDFKSYDPNKETLPFLRSGRFGYLKNRVGVIYKKDVQNFFKSLKIRLFRKGYDGLLRYTYVTELGKDTKRPHFHALIFFEKSAQSLVESEIIASWRFSDLSRPFVNYRNGKRQVRQSIELAISPAEYVAAYLNKLSNVPLFMRKCSPFKPSSRFSYGFGTDFRFFTYDEVLQAYYKRNLRYPSEVTEGGVSTIQMVRIPRYVISKYFPKFKGYRFLTSNEIFNVLIEPAKFSEYAYRCGVDDVVQRDNIITMLKNRKECVLKNSKNKKEDLFEYAKVGSNIWSMFASESIKDSYEDVSTYRPETLFQHFVNLKDYFSGQCPSFFLDEFFERDFVRVIDPNLFLLNLQKNCVLQKVHFDSIRKFNLKSFYYGD